MATGDTPPTQYPDLWVEAQAYQANFGGNTQDIYNKLVAKQGGSSSSTAQSPAVFMGFTTVHGTPNDDNPAMDRNQAFLHKPPPPDTQNPNNMTPDDAVQWLQDRFNDKDPAYQKIVADMVRAGLLQSSDTQNLPKVLGIWSDWVNLSYNNGVKHPGATVSPMEYLSRYADSKNGPDGSGTSTSTSVTYDTPSQADLQAGAQHVYTQALGRRATTAEAAAAASRVGAAAAASPNRSTSTTTQKGNNSSTVTHQTEGMGATAIDDALMQQAMQNPQYAEYQAAAVYAPALFSAVNAINGAGL